MKVLYPKKGSIILTASVLLMIEGLRIMVNNKLIIITVLSSLALYGSWLLVFATTRRLDTISFRHMRRIEENLGISVHHGLFNRVQNRIWYRFGRLSYWLIIFYILLILGYFIVFFRLPNLIL